MQREEGKQGVEETEHEPIAVLFAKASAEFLKGKLVRERGVEPPRPFGHKILSLARLPVPPLPHRYY